MYYYFVLLAPLYKQVGYMRYDHQVFQSKLHYYLGPLAHTDEDDTHTLIGLVSFGPWGCYDDFYPTVYARVTSIMEWIRSYVKEDDEKCPPKK